MGHSMTRFQYKNAPPKEIYEAYEQICPSCKSNLYEVRNVID
jgi:hypothetical protein